MVRADPLRIVLWLPLLFLAVLFGLELCAILLTNNGHFTYTLDDAYIHLALAENIARGHYGVNLQEFSAPSSSILWPLILAPFSRLGCFTYLPLLINLLASLSSVYIFGTLTARALLRSGTEGRLLFSCALVVLLVPITNVVGLLFTGMEHSLQVFLALVILLGLVHERETAVIPWWLSVAIVMGPLVRYENLALSLPALACLALRRHVWALILCTSALAITIVGFSLFLSSLGLGILPSSVLTKSTVAANGGVGAMASNLIQNLWTRQGALLSLGLLLLLSSAVNKRRFAGDRLLAGWAGIALVLHFVCGRFGWYARYEMYVWTTTLLALIYLFGEELVRLQDSVSGSRAVTAVLLCGVAIGWPYASTLITTPLASRNIYEQQYQMHRFISQYWRGPVAANDLGWTSYRNDNYVLDLRGLASREALQAQENTDPAWMDQLAKRHHVGLAMIYRESFKGIPNQWVLVGELHLGSPRITPFSSTVAFYALDSAALERARALATDFRNSLPNGVTFTLKIAPNLRAPLH
jgi:hypothetical protein